MPIAIMATLDEMIGRAGAPDPGRRRVTSSAIDDDDPNADRKLPKVISPADPCSAWTAKANKRVQFGYGLNYFH